MAKRPRKKVSGLIIILLSICFAAYALMYLSERFHLDGIPTLTQFRAFLDRQIYPQEYRPDAADFEVHFIDVGQGDSVLIRCDGQSILIDAGENDKGAVVVGYLHKFGIRTLDLVIGTHPHSDHIGGLDDVLRHMEVKQVILPKIPDAIVPTGKTYTDLLSAIQKQKCPVIEAKPGAEYIFGKGKLTILGPNAAYEDLNNMSVICRFTYGEKSFLFAGDMEEKAEADLLAAYAKTLPSDVLKIAHHGGKSSTGHAFYKVVSPKYCVISVGDENDYGHPHKQTLETIAKNGANVYRTDFQGDIIFQLIDGDFVISTKKQVK